MTAGGQGPYGGPMNDTTDNATAKKRRAPRPRTGSASTAKHEKARQGFELRAQQWLLSRPGRQMAMPRDLDAVTRLGVPCSGCGELIYQHSAADHVVQWRPNAGGHWAAGVTTSCS